MNDCSNADIRDRLPDLLHEHLDAASRAMVVAHVAECVDCRDELELLRSVQKTLIAQTPRVDVAYVVGALPKAPARRPQIQPARRRWTDWRVAAAVTVLIAGGSSVVVMNRAPTSVDTRPPITDTVASRAVAPSIAPVDRGSQSAANAAVTPALPVATVATTDASDTADDGPDGRFGGLSDQQLQALLSEIDQLKAVPVTEPEPVTIRVDLKPGGPEGVP
jgi:anti-sigma factor RsiW